MNTNAPAVSAVFAAFVGIDWADQQHAYSLCLPDATVIERGTIEHTPQGLRAWAEALHQRFAGRPVAVALELKRGPLVWALAAHPFLSLYPVKPITAARMRQAFYPSGAKSDPADSDLLLSILLRHGDKLQPLVLDETETRLLDRLSEDRRQAVDERKRLAQQLGACLKEYFPLALKVAGDLQRDLACQFLLKWPSLEELQASRPHVVRKFFYGRNGRFKIQDRLEQIKSAVALTTDNAVVEAGRRKAQMFCELILAINRSIADYDQRIATLFERHPDRAIFASFPGAGASLGPRLLAAFGTDRSAFAAAINMQNRAGISPVRKSSGNTMIEQKRWACPKFLRQSFHEFAGASIKFSSWAKAYYQTKLAAGKEHHTVLRALAFKWIRIMWACWQYQQPYDEARYLRSLKINGSPFHLCPITK